MKACRVLLWLSSLLKLMYNCPMQVLSFLRGLALFSIELMMHSESKLR